MGKHHHYVVVQSSFPHVFPMFSVILPQGFAPKVHSPVLGAPHLGGRRRFRLLRRPGKALGGAQGGGGAKQGGGHLLQGWPLNWSLETYSCGHLLGIPFGKQT